MKYLKRFNESMEEQIYNQVLDSIKDCFQEFEDNGWQWSPNPNGAIFVITQGSSFNNLSYHPVPHFKYIMKNQRDVIDDKAFDFTGSIDSNGEILWKTKKVSRISEVSPLEILYIERSEEFQDFIVAVKRLHEDTGLDFSFSYNNQDYEVEGGKTIIIQGRI
jgi:hypothetical protein